MHMRRAFDIIILISDHNDVNANPGGSEVVSKRFPASLTHDDI